MSRCAYLVPLIAAALGCSNKPVDLGGIGSSGSSTAGTSSSTGQSPTGTGGSGTTVSGSATSGPSTASSTTSGGSSTGTGTTSSGTSGSGSTTAGTASSSGATSGSGTTTAGSTGTSTSGTTGPALGGPFVPYDGGPHSEPTIDYDAGCTALQPYYNIGAAACVECRNSTDCPTGQVCDPNQSAFQFRCVQCAQTSDCPTGQTCNAPNLDIFWTGTDTCQLDCRDNAGLCNPGFCETDSGICFSDAQVFVFGALPPPVSICAVTMITGWCLTDSDCLVDGGFGACIIPSSEVSVFPMTFFNNGFGYCVDCKVDGGSSNCPSPDEYCAPRGCFPDGTGLPADGPAGSCTFNCLLDAGSCAINSYCSDAGSFVEADGGTITVGVCYPGCQNLSNCGGATPVCVDGGCLQCAQNTDCPDWTPGCLNNLCNGCAATSDCPGSEQCLPAGRCGCFADSDCPQDVPSCAGGDADAGIPGVCACSDNALCPMGTVCDTRFPYTIPDLANASVAGGVCIKACAADADCALAFGPGGYGVCETTTGYCVSCTTSAQCTVNADPNKPVITPSCVLFPDGGNPTVSPTLYTGGGQCGCDDLSQCNGGYACHLAGFAGTCGPPCSFIGGIDSCTPVKSHPDSCNASYEPPPFCNTFTGSCQQCLDDYDCTSTTCNQPFCANGTCVACVNGDSCRQVQPFPTYACAAQACAASCSDGTQCPSDGGYSCLQGPPSGGALCLVTCVLGDDAGLGTVSDAGNPCPPEAPLCVGNPYGSDATVGVCAQCLAPGDQVNCNADTCPNGGSFNCDGLSCTGACF